MEKVQQQPAAHPAQQSVVPPLPAWPTSKPGPKITEPPPGQRRQSLRTEQVVEIQYDPEHGKSSIRGE